MNSRQWNKAVQILDVVTDTDVARKYYRKIAEHYASISEYKVENCDDTDASDTLS